MTGSVLGSTVAEAARRFGDTAAYVTADGWALSYRQLDEVSDEVAAGLAGRRISEGDLVVLAMPSGVDYVVAYVALAKLGAITSGVNPSLTASERSALVRLIAPRTIIGTHDLLDGMITDDHVVIAVEPGTNPDSTLASLRTAGVMPALSADPDRTVCLVFTSGTTGTPKAAQFTDRQMAAIVDMEIGDRWGGGGPSITATQFAHVGFMTKVTWSLRLGGTNHLLGRWRASDVLDLIEARRVASIGAVAPQLAMLLADPDFDRRDLSSVQVVIAGGAASPPALIEETKRRFGAGYVVRYSSTESGGIATTTAMDADDHEMTSTVGRPRAHVEVSIVDGEVCVRSPAVMAGYWNDPEATAQVLSPDGWLRTGDLGDIDTQGRLVLRGRSKEMYIRGGYNVYPAEVEAVLGAHPSIAEIAVVPRPDPVMGEIGVSVVVIRSGQPEPSLGELRSFGGDRLARWKLPEAMRVVDALPRTSALKIDRLRLLERERLPPTTPDRSWRTADQPSSLPRIDTNETISPG